MSDHEELRNHPLLFAVKLIRRDVLKRAMEDPIKPGDWHAVDEVIDRIFNQYVKIQNAQTSSFMSLLNGLDEKTCTDVPQSFRDSITSGQVVSTALASLLIAHYEVILETTRAANDAHLHFDRVLRAADDGQEIVVHIVCLDAEGNEVPKPTRKRRKKE